MTFILLERELISSHIKLKLISIDGRCNTFLHILINKVNIFKVILGTKFKKWHHSVRTEEVKETGVCVLGINRGVF
jgi:hypothetical protein